VAIHFYMDVHVPAAITGALRQRGIDVLTGQDDGTREVVDEVLLARAGKLQRVLVSQEVDLLRIAHQWQSAGRPFPGLIFAHQQGMSIGQCTADLELISECCEEVEMANQVLFLPLF
jgi:predicted nuclease of predicted toxin-antitoxin system